MRDNVAQRESKSQRSILILDFSEYFQSDTVSFFVCLFVLLGIFFPTSHKRVTKEIISLFMSPFTQLL